MPPMSRKELSQFRVATVAEYTLLTEAHHSFSIGGIWEWVVVWYVVVPVPVPVGQ